MDRSNADADRSQSLDLEEFEDSFSLLEKLGRKPGLTVRLNLVVAWKKLIDLAPDEETQNRALGKLVDVAVFAGLPDEQDKVIEATVRELDGANPKLVGRMRQRLRAVLHREEDRSRIRSAALLNLGTSGLVSRSGFSNSIVLFVTLLQMTITRPLLRLRLAWPVILFCVGLAAAVPLMLSSVAELASITLDLGKAVALYAANGLLLAVAVVVVTAPAHLIDRLSGTFDALLCAVVACAAIGLATLISFDAVGELPQGTFWTFAAYLFLCGFAYRLIATNLVKLVSIPALAAFIAWAFAAYFGVWILTETAPEFRSAWIFLTVFLAIIAIATAWVDSSFGTRDRTDVSGRLLAFEAIGVSASLAAVLIGISIATGAIGDLSGATGNRQLTAPCEPGGTGTWVEIRPDSLNEVTLCSQETSEEYDYDLLVRVGLLDDEKFYFSGPDYSWQRPLGQDPTIESADQKQAGNSSLMELVTEFPNFVFDDYVLVGNNTVGQLFASRDDPDPQELWLPNSFAKDLGTLCLQEYNSFQSASTYSPTPGVFLGSCGVRDPMPLYQFARILLMDKADIEGIVQDENTNNSVGISFYICLLALPESNEEILKDYRADEFNEAEEGNHREYGSIKPELTDPQYRRCNDMEVLSNAAAGSDTPASS